MRYIKGIFSENYISTLEFDFETKMVTFNNKIIKMQIWDTAGQNRFRTILNSIPRLKSGGYIFIYDITDGQSFENVKKWIADMGHHSEGKIYKILVGNKCD